jgi:hypothetical protein
MNMLTPTQAEAMAGPGRDTRQWISNGVVNADQPDQPSVDYSSPGGLLVSVRLHPSDIDVRCRVASFVAGSGEGEGHPFVGGSEVVVALPMGHERGGAIIIGRLNNGVDTSPTNVANNDVAKNNLSWKRTIPNFAWEIENGWILRSVTTTAQLALDVKGGWMMSSGDLHFMNLGSRGAILSLAKMQSYVSLDATTGQCCINVGPGKATIILDPASGNVFVSSSGAQPVGHVATVEGVVNMIAQALAAFSLTLASAVPPVTVTPVQAAAAMAAAIPLAASGGVPPTAYAEFASLVTAALGTPRDPTGQAQPGLGAAGFLV